MKTIKSDVFYRKDDRMRIKGDYVLQSIADEHFVVPIASEADRIHGVIGLNETGAFLWEFFSKGDRTAEEAMGALVDEYGIDTSVARDDVIDFIKQVSAIGCWA